MTTFTPIESVVGGGLIGLAAAALMMMLGHIAGISGITEEVLPPWPRGEDNRWRVGFVIGLVISPLLYAGFTGSLPAANVSTNIAVLIAGGLLVGFGTAFGHGCTSGHGVCGLARLSRRSIVAVVIFLLTGVLTTSIARHVVGGGLS